MFINKNVKSQKNPNPVLTELPCDGGDNGEGDDDEVDGSIKDVGFDVNAGNGKNKVDLGDVYNGDGGSNDDVGVGSVGGVNTNGGDDVDFGNGDSKFDCGDDRGSGDDGDKDDGGVNDGRMIMAEAKLIAVKIQMLMTVVVNLMVVVILMMMVRVVGDDSDGESNECPDGHKNDVDDDDGRLNSVKNCFKNKQIVLEIFSLPVSTR